MQEMPEPWGPAHGEDTHSHTPRASHTNSCTLGTFVQSLPFRGPGRHCQRTSLDISRACHTSQGWRCGWG